MRKGIVSVGFLFDLDGVIIDSESEYSRIWAKINCEFPTGIKNLEKKIKGCTLIKILSDYYPDPIISEKVAERLHQLESEMNYNFLPYSEEFILNLREIGIPRVLVTSSDEKKMQQLWKQLPQLKDYFDYIITGNLVKSSKPSPEGYLLGAQKIKCSPKNCVVFEDSLQGVMAGRNAGSLVVGVRGTFPEETIAPYSDYLINNFQEIDLDSLIQELAQR